MEDFLDDLRSGPVYSREGSSGEQNIRLPDGRRVQGLDPQQANKEMKSGKYPRGSREYQALKHRAKQGGRRQGREQGGTASPGCK